MVASKERHHITSTLYEKVRLEPLAGTSPGKLAIHASSTAPGRVRWAKHSQTSCASTRKRTPTEQDSSTCYLPVVTCDLQRCARKRSKASCVSKHMRELLKNQRARGRSNTVLRRRASETKHQYWNPDSLNKYPLRSGQNTAMSTGSNTDAWEDLSDFWGGRFYF